eukprot:TRINITY_DN16421_c0_g3_i1.p1 TRINITY_DN16421_c0_g3~~TRINITY_DN16421_c0_g3_i1.p1  ORF type:complete len:347 (-),score=46.95 TRINITY_DN16421_c0_g3_i1:106-1146(-)
MALPPNWSKYTTDEGKEYYHNSVTNKTQWDKPESHSGPDSLSFHSQSSEVYRPSDSDLEIHDRLPEGNSKLLSMEAAEAGMAGQEARGGTLPMTDSETVSLRTAPQGNIASDSVSSSGFGLLASAASGSEEGVARVQGLTAWALTSAQQLFDVSSDDVVKRLRLSLTPMQAPLEESANDFRTKPDFYGPFWVATTAVLFLAATGNFATLLSAPSKDDFKADYSLVSLAATMIYGCLVGVPIATRIALYCSGHEVDTLNFKQVICVYGYSLTPTIPVSMVCIVPLGIVRWFAILVGLSVSLLFIRGALWTDIAIEAPSLKWKMFGLFAAAQASIFFIYRMYFFTASV